MKQIKIIEMELKMKIGIDIDDTTFLTVKAMKLVEN